MTEKEYYQEINELATELKAESTHDSLADNIHEAVDGHQFVIYYHQAREVALISENRNALYEDFGDEQSNKDGMLDCRRAYCAMERDIYEAIERNK